MTEEEEEGQVKNTEEKGNLKKNTEETGNQKKNTEDREKPKRKRFRPLKEYIIIFITGAVSFALFPITAFWSFAVLKDYERAVLFRLGRTKTNHARGPGVVFLLPFTDSLVRVDMRTESFNVPPQQILTKDSVPVTVDAAVFYKVIDAYTSVTKVARAHSSTRLLAQTTLRNVMGMQNLSELLSEQESIAQHLQETIDEATDRWGIQVERVEIKGVKLPTPHSVML